MSRVIHAHWVLPLAATLLLAGSSPTAQGEDWPGWRGLGLQGVSSDKELPTVWSGSKHIRWKVEIPGEGSSSPVISRGRIFLTSSLDDGLKRVTHCLDQSTGTLLWSRAIDDDNPEITSALTGYAAPTPATDGTHLVAQFGNAGAVGYDFAGNELWRRDFGEFDSELGLASSPIVHDGMAILLCDHDGTRFRTFDSFLIALDLETGRDVWKADRPKLFRSWSTPLIVRAGESDELVVNAQDEVRGYDPATGTLLWQARGMTGWVTPTPVAGHGLIFAASGKDGPTMALRPGGRGDVTESHVAWTQVGGAPYVCSPLLYGDELYVYNEQGILNCYDARTGTRHYRVRLAGKFLASGVAGAGHVYITNEDGTTYVLRAGTEFHVVSENPLDDPVLASPAIAEGCLYLRGARHLYCIGPPTDE